MHLAQQVNATGVSLCLSGNCLNTTQKCTLRTVKVMQDLIWVQGREWLARLSTDREDEEEQGGRRRSTVNVTKY